MIVFENEKNKMKRKKCRLTRVSICGSLKVSNYGVSTIDNTRALTEHVQVFHPPNHHQVRSMGSLININI